MGSLSADVVKKCKSKLLETKMDLLNRVKNNELNLARAGDERGGDETDVAVRNLAEDEAVMNQERMRFQLREIEIALAKIEEGSYGICEETDELIEPQRLLAIPWTRLSIEGAEIRESMSRRFAR